MFSNLSNGSTIYVLQTKDGLKYDVCVVDAIKPSFQYNYSSTPMVDIAVTIDGHRREFSGVQANSSVSQSNNYVITDSRDAMVGQIKNRLQNDNDQIDKFEFYKNDAEQCRELLGKLNPEFAKEKAFDTALTNMSSRVDSMQDEIGNMRTDMKAILELLTKKQN